MRWAGHVARMWQGKSVYRVLVGKSEGKKPLARTRFKWEDDIKRIFTKWGMDWINLARIGAGGWRLKMQ